MSKHYNLAKMSTATTGTGTISLNSAIASFLSFAAAGVADGDSVTYVIEDGVNREVGRGVYTASGTSLTRATILASTNSGSAISLSGTAIVGICAAAEDFIHHPNASLTATEKTQARNTISAEPQGAVFGFNDQTGTTYTLVLGDKGKRVTMNNASANTLTVPPNSSVAFAVGDRIEVFQRGAGQTAIAAGAGVTIQSSGTKLKLTGQYSAAILTKTATDTWDLIGDIAA